MHRFRAVASLSAIILLGAAAEAAPRKPNTTGPKPHTTADTRRHVHQGETASNPASPYHGLWNGRGLHTWSGLKARVAKDGYKIERVWQHPTGVRYVQVRKMQTGKGGGAPVPGGAPEKSIYPPQMSEAAVDATGERALTNAADKRLKGSSLEPPAAAGQNGKFEADVKIASGKTIHVAGYFKQDPRTKKRTIVSHYPDQGEPAAGGPWKELRKW